MLEREDYRLLAAFKRALTLYTHASTAWARREGLTVQQFNLLLAIQAAPGNAMTVGELAEALCIRHHAAVELSQRAEAAGLIARHADPDEVRRVLLRLTPRMERRIGSLVERHALEMAEARAELVSSLSLWNGRLGRLNGRAQETVSRPNRRGLERKSLSRV